MAMEISNRGLLVLAVLGLLSFAAAARAAEPLEPGEISCDSLPADAVKTVPAPFDRYVRLGCTQLGQALKPAKGYQWRFQEGPMWLMATAEATKHAYFVRLSADPLSPVEIDALRRELRKVSSDPYLMRRQIIRLSETNSAGFKKELYLLLPPADAPAGTEVQGMECITHCRPIDQDPWTFAVEAIR